MTSIGIRELRQHASVYLRQVQSGKTIEITDRGRPVALLCPIPDDTPLEKMIVAGQARPAKGKTYDLPEPAEPVPGRKTLTDTLLRMRADERY